MCVCQECMMTLISFIVRGATKNHTFYWIYACPSKITALDLWASCWLTSGFVKAIYYEISLIPRLSAWVGELAWEWDCKETTRLYGCSTTCSNPENGILPAQDVWGSVNMFIVTQHFVAKPTNPHLVCKGLCRPHASLKCIVASDSVKVNAEWSHL